MLVTMVLPLYGGGLPPTKTGLYVRVMCAAGKGCLNLTNIPPLGKFVILLNAVTAKGIVTVYPLFVRVVFVWVQVCLRPFMVLVVVLVVVVYMLSPFVMFGVTLHLHT
jgi:hypothetical protein